MKCQNRCWWALLSLFVALGLAACDSDDSDTTATDTSAATSQSTSAQTDSGTETASASNETSSSSTMENIGGVWVTIEESTNSTSPDFPLGTHALNAAQCRNPDGTYSWGDLVFSNCDACATYLTSITAPDPIIVTNCGTPAFP